MNKTVILLFCLLQLSFAAAAVAEEILTTIPRPVGTNSSAFFGFCMADVGDQNGDGHPDLLVGMPGSAHGHAFLFHGGPALDETPDLTITGPHVNSMLGWSMAGLGDFNADGKPDFAIGQPSGIYQDVPAQVHVFYGGPALNAEADLLLSVDGNHFSWIGGALAGGHDLNGDGHPDLAAFARSDTSSSGDYGRVYIYFGGPAVDDQPDLVIDGPVGSDQFGFELQMSSDVTGDGYPDLLALVVEPYMMLVFAGGPGFDGQPDALFFPGDEPALISTTSAWRSHPRLAVGDLDGDGQDEICLGSSHWDLWRGRVQVIDVGAAGELEVVHEFYGRRSGISLPEGGSTFGDEFGRMVDLSADVDGDGTVDLLVGEVGSSGRRLRGYLSVYRGGDLTELERTLVMSSDNELGRFAQSAASVGDLDGDGDDEVMIGSLSPYGYIWVVDEFFYDCDGDDVPDLDGVDAGLIPDCDGDRVPDPCQIALWPEEECDGDGIPDGCAIAADPGLDCDRNGLIDDCEI